MFKQGDYVVYKRDVCKIVEIKEKHFNNSDYYILVPITDNSLKIDVPTTNSSEYLRYLITKEEVDTIINHIPEITIIESNEKLIENEYRRLLNSGSHEDLIKIIKTTYLRNKQRLDSKKKIGDKDKYYFEKAEKYLYNEFSIVLNMNYEDTKNYVVERVNLINNT